MQTTKLPPTTPKAILYCRVSSEGQVEGTSLDTQLDRGRAFCSSQGWSLSAIFKEEGESGKSTDREAFQQMVAYLQDNPINTLLVFKLDRLFRNLKDMLIFIDDELEHRNIALQSVTENFNTQSPEGRLFLQLLGSFAEFERKRINERTMSGKVATAKKGGFNGGHTPYGYRRIDGSEQDFDICPEEAKTVRKIFKLYAGGKGYMKINKLIDGVISIQGIAKLIDSPFYIGLVRFNNIVKPNNHPCIVSERLFKKCARVRQSKALAACAV